MFTPSRLIGSVLALAVSAAVVATARQPRITNGKFAVQPSGTLAQTFRTILAAESDVVWIGYSVAAVDGERMMCCFGGDTSWSNGAVVVSDGRGCCRACRLEPPSDGNAMAKRATTVAAPGVVQLSGSERMVVLYRVAQGAVERIRIFSEDCELDAGGRRIVWLENVRAADSIAQLESLATSERRTDRLADGAISAIALHGDPAADTSLERLSRVSQPEAQRRKVTFWLGNARGARGLATLKRILAEDPSADVQKGAVFGVAQSREPGVVEALVALARTDARPKVRGEALFWLAQKAGVKAADAITQAIEQDPETEVKKRALLALSQMPKDEGVPLLIKVARTHANPAVRKQAMFWLGQSNDPRAIEFFAEILK